MTHFLDELKKIEGEVAEYVEASGKSIEAVFVEIKDFLVHKKVEAQNAQAANSNSSPPSSPPGPKAA